MLGVAEVTPPSWEEAGSYPAYMDRMTLAALLQPSPAGGPFTPWGGVKPSYVDAGLLVTQDVTADMYVLVQTGTCFVPAAIQTNAGWVCHNNGTVSRVIEPASPTYPRIDVVIAHVYDAVDDSGTQNTWALEVVEGTPAAVPVVPAIPTNALALAQIAVPANATSITTADITDVRTWEVALGGILPVNGLASVPEGYWGQYVYDRVTQRLAHNTPLGVYQPRILPVAQSVASGTTQVTSTGNTNEVTLLTTTITTDGLTDLEILLKLGAVSANQSGSPSFTTVLRIYLDNVQIDAVFTGAAPADNLPHSGVSITSLAATATLGGRPTAGTHTVKVTFESQATFAANAYASSTNPYYVRVKPICQLWPARSPTISTTGRRILSSTVSLSKMRLSRGKLTRPERSAPTCRSMIRRCPPAG